MKTSEVFLNRWDLDDKNMATIDDRWPMCPIASITPGLTNDGVYIEPQFDHALSGFQSCDEP